MYIGFGYDIHPLVEGRKLFLGGIEIPYTGKGLLGHSDADVLVHAICDALLGAAGLGDIGVHFPDKDPLYKDISSLSLLAKVFNLITQAGFIINNIDSTVVSEVVMIAPYRDSMREEIAKILSLERSRVNIKATTAEGMGHIGADHAIEAYCVAMLLRP
ncbi:MAG: 2-C-methyl-D-erythritol 2,4-cyclodiphosphate synthase [Pseudomonadota bacterium]